MGKRVSGTCFIKVDGAQLEVEGSVEVPMSQVKRESKMALTGCSGYDERAAEPFVKVSAFVTPDFPRSKLENGTDMTVTAELANGMTYVLSSAWLNDAPSLKADDGKVELYFGGLRGEYQ